MHSDFALFCDDFSISFNYVSLLIQLVCGRKYALENTE